MKRLILFFLISCLPCVVLGQPGYGHGLGISVVSDTASIDKSKGLLYYYTVDDHLYKANGNYLEWILTVTNDGQANQVLYTNGSGNLGWVDQAGSGQAWYGVSWDAGYDADTYTRLGTLADSAASATIPDALLPIQAAMKRCVLKNDGTVNYYLRSDNSNYKENGEASDLTGGDGQVMVEIPKFYYYYHYSGSDSVYTWKISQDSLTGYIRHPAFLKDGAYVDHRYISAYEASLYDASNSAYQNGLYIPTSTVYQYEFVDGGASEDTIRCIDSSGVALTNPFSVLEAGDQITVSGTTSNNTTVTVASKSDIYFTVPTATVVAETSMANVYAQTNFAADTLSSVSGKSPAVQGTRANFRTAASLRGTGWRQQDYQLTSAVQLLYLVEFANFNSQSKIGNGLTDWSSGTWSGWNNYNPIEKTGNSNTDGNSTANVSGGNGITGSYMSYRGIENFYGHVWKWVDGFNVNNNIAYICNNETQYADDTATNYEQIGTLINANGYQKYLLNNLNGFLPIAVGASSTTYICDYYYQSTGWRVAVLGGCADVAGNGGSFFWVMSYGAGIAYRYISARVCY